VRLAIFYDHLDTIDGAERLVLTVARHFQADLITTSFDPDLPPSRGVRPDPGDLTRRAAPGPAIHETIIGGETGFLLPPTPEAFASRIGSLDDATFQSMPSACIDRARQFDVAAFLKKIETALGRGGAA